jgi:hypothetical protein
VGQGHAQQPAGQQAAGRRLGDGRQYPGVQSGYTAHAEDNRELALVRPAVRSGPGAVRVDADFVILREADIVSIAGRYVAPGPSVAAGDRAVPGA